MKIILLNGPPRCGKDTAARAIRTAFGRDWTFRWEKFSLPHKQAFAAIMQKQIDKEGNVEYFEQHKEEVIPALGVSYRRWQISFSEDFMKPLFGNDIFAKLFLLRQGPRLTTDRYLTAVSDCGFEIEVETVRAHCPKDTLLIRIERPGCDFTNDSREYVSDPDVVVTNDGTELDFEFAIAKSVRDFLHGVPTRPE